MDSRFKLANIRISTKLLVVNTLIFGVFVLISLVVFWSNRHAQGLIRALMVHDIGEVTVNALTERELFSIQSDAGLLLNTFFGKGAYLATEGNQLLTLTRALVDRNKDRDLAEPLRAFYQGLASLLQQCVAVNDVLHLLSLSEEEIAVLMDRLEETISKKLIDLTFNGEDTGLVEQLASLVAGYRTSMLEIGKLRAESWPSHYYEDMDPADDTILTAMDELILRCRTLTASDVAVAQLGRRLIRALQGFREENQRLRCVMSGLNRRIKALGIAKEQVRAAMEALDRDVARAILTVDGKIDSRLRVVGIALLSLTIFLGVGLGLLTTLFFKRTIKSPIETIREGIEGLQGGDLDTRIRLDRKDEWSVIERALNSMATRLSESYSTLRFKEHIIESAAIAIVTSDLDGKTTYVNPAFLETWGFDDPAEVMGKALREFWIVKERSDEIKRALWDKGGWRDDIQARRKDGSVFDVQASASMVFDAQDQPMGMMVTSLDITDRKEAEEELHRLRNLLKNIVDSMPSMLVAVDSDGCVTQWNRQVAELTGVSAGEAQGRTLLNVFPQLAVEMDRVRQAIRERRPLKDEKVTNFVRGEKRFLEVTVYPLTSNGVEGAVIRVDDVTDRVRMEEMMIQSEKMLSVGGLAAGMAHEINNPLAAILQNAQVVFNRISKDLPANRQAAADCGTSMEAIKSFMEKRNILKMLEAIRSSGERTAKIVENMLSFSRKSDSRFLPRSLSELLDNTVALASSDYNLKKKYDFRKIEIVREYDPDLPDVACEETKIQQVVLNLLKNAAQSMAELRDRSEAPRIVLRLFQHGDMARLEVEDNGPGMENDVRKRVFDPFFTTKKLGAGTGLGLSVSFFIITENHGGSMAVESTPGQGSKFIIDLPIRRNGSIEKGGPQK